MLSGYRAWQRVRDKVFTLLCARGFRRFGARTVIALPVRIWGERRIEIGSGVYVGANSWLLALDGRGEETRPVAISIGDRTSISGDCTITAVREVTLESGVLIGRNVHISDHAHHFARRDLPIRDQGVSEPKPVRICSGAWLGQGVVVCPGVTIGRNAVVGANSVVRSDIDDYCVAVGAPARVVRRLEPSQAVL